MDKSKEEIENKMGTAAAEDPTDGSNEPAEQARQTGGDNTTSPAEPSDLQPHTTNLTSGNMEAITANVAQNRTTTGDSAPPRGIPVVGQHHVQPPAGDIHQHTARGETQSTLLGPDSMARTEPENPTHSGPVNHPQIPNYDRYVQSETVQTFRGDPQGVHITTHTPTHTGDQATGTEVERKTSGDAMGGDASKTMIDTIVQTMTDRMNKTFAQIDTMVMERDQSIRNEMANLTLTIQANSNTSNTGLNMGNRGTNLPSNAGPYYGQYNSPDGKYTGTEYAHNQPTSTNYGEEPHPGQETGYAYGQTYKEEFNQYRNTALPYQQKWSVKEVRSMEPLTSPQKQLFTAMKGLTRKTISTSMSDFTEWHRYMNTLLQACYLSCLTMAHPHTLPKTKEQWDLLDEKILINDFEKATRCLRQGSIPPTDQLSTNVWIMTVFHSVIKMFPDILHTLYTLLVNSLGDSMRFLVENNEVNATSFRVILFGVANYFVQASDSAKAARFKKWMEGQKYTLNQSIAAYDAQLRKEANAINLLYDPTGSSKMISTGLIQVQLVEKIRASTGQRYVATLDILKHQGATYTTMVQKLQEKYLEERQMGKNESANASISCDHSPGEMDHDHNQTSNYANFSGEQEPRKPKTQDSRRTKLPRYCWMYAKTESCKYGPKCKFKHIKEADLPKHDEKAYVIQWANSLANMDRKHTMALAQAKGRTQHWKKRYSAVVKSQKSRQNKTQGNQPTETTFEDTVRKTASAYSATGEDEDKSEEEEQEESNSDTDSSGSDYE
jgi:hypothetical protein